MVPNFAMKYYKLIEESFVCTQLNDFKHRKWLNMFIRPTDGIQTGTTTRGQSGLENNGSERVLHITQSFRTGVWTADRHSQQHKSFSLQRCSRYILMFKPTKLKITIFWLKYIKPYWYV